MFIPTVCAVSPGGAGHFGDRELAGHQNMGPGTGRAAGTVASATLRPRGYAPLNFNKKMHFDFF